MPISRTPISAKTAADHINVALDSCDNRSLLQSLRYVAEQVGVARLAQASGLNREHLYRVLAPTGNPQLDTFIRILKSLRLVIRVEPMSAADIKLAQATELKTATGLTQDSLFDSPPEENDLFPDEFPPEDDFPVIEVNTSPKIELTTDEDISVRSFKQPLSISPLTNHEIGILRLIIQEYEKKLED
jgi:probable addiction module antidote protein